MRYVLIVLTLNFFFLHAMDDEEIQLNQQEKTILEHLKEMSNSIEFNYKIVSNDDESAYKVFGPVINPNGILQWNKNTRNLILQNNIINENTPQKKGIERFLCQEFPKKFNLIPLRLKNLKFERSTADEFNNFLRGFIESLEEKDFRELVDRSYNIGFLAQQGKNDDEIVDKIELQKKSVCQLNELTKYALYRYVFNLLYPNPYKEKPSIPENALYAFYKKTNFETEIDIKISVQNLFQELSSQMGKNEDKTIENLEKIREEFVNEFIARSGPYNILLDYQKEIVPKSLAPESEEKKIFEELVANPYDNDLIERITERLKPSYDKIEDLARIADAIGFKYDVTVNKNINELITFGPSIGNAILWDKNVIKKICERNEIKRMGIERFLYIIYQSGEDKEKFNNFLNKFFLEIPFGYIENFIVRIATKDNTYALQKISEIYTIKLYKEWKENNKILHPVALLYNAHRKIIEVDNKLNSPKLIDEFSDSIINKMKNDNMLVDKIDIFFISLLKQELKEQYDKELGLEQRRIKLETQERINTFLKRFLILLSGLGIGAIFFGKTLAEKFRARGFIK